MFYQNARFNTGVTTIDPRELTRTHKNNWSLPYFKPCVLARKSEPGMSIPNAKIDTFLGVGGGGGGGGGGREREVAPVFRP